MSSGASGSSAPAASSRPPAAEAFAADLPVAPGDRNDLVWRRLLRFWGVFAAMWAVALAYHFVMGAVLQRRAPYSTFLFDPLDRFNDLTVTWRQALTPDPYRAGGSYFPAVYAAFSLAPAPSRAALLLGYVAATFGAVLALAAVWIRRERARWGADPRWPAVAGLVLVACLANYPLLFAVDRGNLDPLVMIALFGAIGCMERGRPIAGGALLALSASPKGYSIAAVVLWLRRRRWAGAVVAVAALAALVVLPGLMFERGVAGTLHDFRVALGAFRERYVLGSWSSQYSADPLNAIRNVVSALGYRLDAARAVPVYEAIAMAWAGLLVLSATLVAREEWRVRLAVVLVMLVFPNVTNDYKLVLLLPVFLSWLSSGAGGWRDRLFGICVALLFVPKHYARVGGGLSTLSCVVSPFLLVGLSAVLWPTADERARLSSALGRLPWTRPRAGGHPRAPESAIVRPQRVDDLAAGGDR